MYALDGVLSDEKIYKPQVGDKVFNIVSGVYGEVIRISSHAKSDHQIIIKTPYNHRYQAPISTWIKHRTGTRPSTILMDELASNVKDGLISFINKGCNAR